MKAPHKFGVSNDLSFDKEECDKLSIPTIFISLKTSSWLDEEELAKRIVYSSVGTIKNADMGLSLLIQELKKLKSIQDIPIPTKAFTVNKMLLENYKIHAGLGATTADNIIEAAILIQEKDIEEYESEGSCKSEDCHPQRTKEYNADDTPMLKELRAFRCRSVELTKDNMNQVSDLRLLSLDFIYLFSENIKNSVTKYLGTEAHFSSIPTFESKKCKDIDPIVFKWCMELTNFNFEDNNNKWMELQRTTINILSEAMMKNDKTLLQIANMLHTVAPRLLISSNELNFEDTFVHTIVSYIIKLIFGIENMLMHQWANGRLNPLNKDIRKFKPDYIAYIKTRSTRHDITVAEFKPVGTHSGKPPSDLVKLGQQMKTMLNDLISHKVGNPVVCGILVQGKVCSLYKMDLIAPRFYRMILLASFSLCTSSSELCLIPNTFLWIAQLKDITVDTAKKVEKGELAKAKGKREFEEVIPTSWVHNGTCIYTKVKKTRR
ncbi:hypothetical protein BDF14DRAFT_2000049 [Spinellus fusiger]|nr:hypothetical protein BDF14DRAFT_2000049 [Spinellus fusiger]